MRNSEKNALNQELFIRGQDHIYRYCGDEVAGISLNRNQVEEYFGNRVFDEIEDYGSAIIPGSHDEPSKTLRETRKSLGLSIVDLAKAAKIEKSLIEKAEDRNRRSDIRDLTKIAQFLGIKNDVAIGADSASGDRMLGARLKSAKNSAENAYTASTVAKLSEASWIIATQISLAKKLGNEKCIPSSFSPDPNYGSAAEPPHVHAYRLAARTRDMLAIEKNKPIDSIGKILEDQLGIPVVWSELGGKIAGATVSAHGCRGVVLNSKFRNGDVTAFRFTMAHELAHILWDGDKFLDSLVVDSFHSLKSNFKRVQVSPSAVKRGNYFVEVRANAFAAEFLAPRDAAFQVYSEHKNKSKNGILAVMNEFGVGYNCAKHQIENYRNGDNIGDETFDRIDMDPDRLWVSSESAFYAADLANIKLSRGSRFSEVVVNCLLKDIITESMALSYLDCTTEDLKRVKNMLGDISS